MNIFEETPSTQSSMSDRPKRPCLKKIKCKNFLLHYSFIISIQQIFMETYTSYNVFNSLTISYMYRIMFSYFNLLFIEGIWSTENHQVISNMEYCFLHVNLDLTEAGPRQRQSLSKLPDTSSEALSVSPVAIIWKHKFPGPIPRNFD